MNAFSLKKETLRHLSGRETKRIVGGESEELVPGLNFNGDTKYCKLPPSVISLVDCSVYCPDKWGRCYCEEHGEHDCCHENPLTPTCL